MTATATTQGDVWANKALTHNLGGQLAIVKVGTGTAAESKTHTGLANQVYASTAGEDVTVTDLGDKTEFTIDLHGGQNVPAGSAIAELGVFVPGGGVDWARAGLDTRRDGDGDLMYARTLRSPTTLGRGEGTQAYIVIPWTR